MAESSKLDSSVRKELEAMTWRESWRPELASAELVAELRRETNVKHPLFGKDAVSLAQRTDSDGVLFHLPGSNPPFAVVFLTWSGSVETGAEFPVTFFYDSLERFADEVMVPDYLDMTDGVSSPSIEVVTHEPVAFGAQVTTAKNTSVKDESTPETTRKTGLMYAAVMSLVFSVLTCLLGGLALDEAFDTSPKLVVVGIIVGAIVGFYQFIRLVSRVE